MLSLQLDERGGVASPAERGDVTFPADPFQGTEQLLFSTNSVARVPKGWECRETRRNHGNTPRRLTTVALSISFLSLAILSLYYLTSVQTGTGTTVLSLTADYSLFDIRNESNVLLYLEMPYCSTSLLQLLEEQLQSPCSNEHCVRGQAGNHGNTRGGEPWLLSGHSAALPCGNLPSYSTFSNCLSSLQPRSTPYILTSLCHPVTRFISEYHHLQQLRDTPFWRECYDGDAGAGSSRTFTEESGCVYAADLASYVRCADNPAANRMTRLLTDSSCNLGPIGGYRDEIITYILQSAIYNLESTNFVGVQEYQELSLQVFNQLFPDMEIVGVPGGAQGVPGGAGNAMSAASYNITEQLLQEIVHLNRYDIMLYGHGIKRLSAYSQYFGLDSSVLDGSEVPTGIPGPYDGILEYNLRHHIVPPRHSD